jgi:hypothetical protein
MLQAETSPDRSAVLATISDYFELQRALRERADALNFSRAQIDILSNFPSGYAAKILSPVPIRKLGNSSLPFLLAALGCRLELVEDAQSMAEIARKATQREVRVPVRAVNNGHGRHQLVSLKFLRKISRLGGLARARKLSPAQRRKSARHAATIRWRDVREAAREPNR